MAELRRLELDPVRLKAMAHPLRVEILRVLQQRKRASVTSLADELGETTGAMSYHLRQLARHGFIEEDRTRGTLRERYWRATSGNQRLASQSTRST